jgi:hypothetical protein
LPPPSLPLARVRPSGLNATEQNPGAGAVANCLGPVGRAGSLMSHKWIVPVPPKGPRLLKPRLLLAARVRPSGLNATELTSSGMARGGPRTAGSAGSATSHR